MKTVTVVETLEIIRKLRISHTYGRDEINTAILKLAARVILLLKSIDADKTNPASYRPVSLLPVILKLAERSVQSQLLQYLE